MMLHPLLGGVILCSGGAGWLVPAPSCGWHQHRQTHLMGTEELPAAGPQEWQDAGGGQAAPDPALDTQMQP